MAAHPANADIIYVGAVNGGIWKTINGTSDSPTWTPLTDGQTSLSIGALKFDPTDPTRNTLIAGIGRYSAYLRRGGPRTGLLLTTNGGSTWKPIDGGGKLAGINMSGVAARGSVILATADSADNFVCDNLGIFRSTDGGKNFSRISGTAGSGLPAGRVFDLTEDPGNNSVLYAPVLNENPCTSSGASGLYKSTDTGATWNRVSDATMNALFTPLTVNSKLAAGAGNNVYFGIENASPGNTGMLAGLFRSVNGGANWTMLDVPDVNPVGQGALDFSIAIDPKNPALVYVAGDLEGFRLDSTKASGRQAAPIWFNNTAHDTAPHPDSRAMTFDANGNLLDVDDGGIYRRTSPDTAAGDWFSIDGNLQVAEIVVVAFDSNSKVVFAGVQDNGALLQLTPDHPTWKPVLAGDAGDVALDLTSSAPNSIRYLSIQNFQKFTRNTYSPSNVLLSSVTPALTVMGGGARIQAQGPITPLKVDAYAPRRIVIGGQNALYESFDQADTITELKPAIKANNNAIAYGAIVANGANLEPNADVLFVGAGSLLYKRAAPPPAELVPLTAYPGRAPINGVAVSPRLPFVWVTDASNVYFSNDSGTSWFNVTGNLATFGAGAIRSLVAGSSTALIVGTDRGVFVEGPSANWSEVGTGLPHAPVFDLYTEGSAPAFGALIAGTLGRGAWRFASFATVTPTPTPKPTPTPTATRKPGPTPTTKPGAVVFSVPVTDVAPPGTTVAAGAFTITNELAAAETVASVTVGVSRPGLFSSMTLNGGGQSVTVTPPVANTMFTFARPLTIPAGGSISFSLSAVIAANPVMLGSDIKYAGLTLTVPRSPTTWPLSGALLMLGMSLLGLPYRTRRRALILAVLVVGLAAASAGCGGGNSGPRIESSAQEVTAVTVTADGMPEPVVGLPASLGSVTD